MTGQRSRLTQKELRAINEALAIRLAGEYDASDWADGVGVEDYESAKAKVEARINWKTGE